VLRGVAAWQDPQQAASAKCYAQLPSGTHISIRNEVMAIQLLVDGLMQELRSLGARTTKDSSLLQSRMPVEGRTAILLAASRMRVLETVVAAATAYGSCLAHQNSLTTVAFPEDTPKFVMGDFHTNPVCKKMAARMAVAIEQGNAEGSCTAMSSSEESLDQALQDFEGVVTKRFFDDVLVEAQDSGEARKDDTSTAFLRYLAIMQTDIITYKQKQSVIQKVTSACNSGALGRLASEIDECKWWLRAVAKMEATPE